MIDHHEDFLRTELRHALDSRSPDRTAMLNRIAANRAAGPRPRGMAVRLAGSALAVATVLGIGGVAKWALADDYEVAPAPAAPPPATLSATTAPAPSSAPETSRAPSSAPGTTRAPSSAGSSTSTGPTAPTPSVSPVRGHPGDTQVEKGSLWSDGSIVGAGQSDVTLEAGADLTEMELDVRVTTTSGLVAGGGVTDVPGGAVTVTVSEEADALLYHFELGAGKTLTAGTYVFSARYGGGARDAEQDTYEAYATSVERKRIHIYGNFLPKD